MRSHHVPFLSDLHEMRGAAWATIYLNLFWVVSRSEHDRDRELTRKKNPTDVVTPFCHIKERCTPHA